MIAYFDTSAIVPLIVEESSSPICVRLWNDATRVLSVRLLYPEASAALARAERMGRLTPAQHRTAVNDLGELVTEIDYVEVTAQLAKNAGELAREHHLRGYDAVHLAASVSAADSNYFIATGDHALASAAYASGLSVARTA